MSCPGVLCHQPALPRYPAPLPQPRPLAALVQAWLAMAALAPLNWLCQRLVAAKVRTALGVKTCVVSGGGSLATHLDEFYEVGAGCGMGWVALLRPGMLVLACAAGAHPHCLCPLGSPPFPPPWPQSIGLPVINGWGLTETSPVLACRRNAPRQNVRGSVGAQRRRGA